MYIRMGDFTLDVTASGVYNDPLEELIDLGLFALSNGSGFRRVSIWLEPEGYAIDVFASGADMTLLRVSWSDTFTPPMTTRPLTARYECAIPHNTLANGVFRGLSNFFDSVPPSTIQKWYSRLDQYKAKMERFVEGVR